MFASRALCLVTLIIVQQTNFVLSDCINDEYYPDASDCRLFYHCSNGQLFQYRCPEGLHFNSVVDFCDFPKNTNCNAEEKITERIIEAPSSPTTTELPTPPTPAPQICKWEPGQEIAIGNWCYVLHGFFLFQYDGNAVIYDINVVPLWTTDTIGVGHRLVFQTDGNLVMYSINDVAVWNSASHDQGGNLLVFQDDRNLVIYNSDKVAIWNSGTSVCDSSEYATCDVESTTTAIPSPTGTPTTPEITTTTTPPTTPAPECQWAPGQEISMGNRCYVPDGFFTFQLDGNAVIYDNNIVPLWHIYTTGIGHRLVFETDGNLVMYSIDGTAVWNSGSQNQGGNLLIFQEDRNLVIYDSASVALWNTGTSACDPENGNCDVETTTTTTEPSPTVPSTASPTTESTPPTPAPECQWELGQEIPMGNRCHVPDGFFAFQLDGNAVIYDNNLVPLWHTHTAGIGHKLVFQSDGNLVMYSVDGSAVWNSGSHDQGGTLLIFQEDRNLVIYDSASVALWNAGTHVV